MRKVPSDDNRRRRPPIRPVRRRDGGLSPPPADQEPGGLGLRFAARLIDGIIVLVAAVAIGFVLNMLVGYWGNTGLMPSVINGIISGLLTFICFVPVETSQGWTPGKKVLGLSVHGPGGAPRPTVQQSAIRNVWTLFPIIPLLIGNGPVAYGDRLDRGDDQRQPDQAGQTRRARRRYPGRQGLTGRFVI